MISALKLSDEDIKKLKKAFGDEFSLQAISDSFLCSQRRLEKYLFDNFDRYLFYIKDPDLYSQCQDNLSSMLQFINLYFRHLFQIIEHQCLMEAMKK